jgi:hypothetical protein
LWPTSVGLAFLGAAAMLPLVAVVGGATVHRLGVQATVLTGLVIAAVGPAGLALARTTEASGQPSHPRLPRTA